MTDRNERMLNRLVNRLVQVENFLKEIDAEVDVYEINVRVVLLEEIWREYNKLDSEIDERSVTLNGICDTIESAYVMLKPWLLREEKSRVKDVNQGQVPGPSKTHIKLPKLNIHPFSGEDITLWPQFKDIYESAVHNLVQIPAIQKFQFF